MTEFSGVGESVRKLCAEPFVQADELVQITGDIPQASLGGANLELWLGAARLVQKNTGCSALSFNQLHSQLLTELGFGTAVPPSIIYVQDGERRKSMLLINPRVSYDSSGLTYPMLEACGSIDHGHMGYVVSRPSSFALTASVFDGNTLTGVDTPNTIENRMMYPHAVHEDIHLRHGQTALDNPAILWDITQKSVWEQFLQSGSFVGESSWLYMLTQLSPHGIVVPTSPRGYSIAQVSEVGIY